LQVDPFVEQFDELDVHAAGIGSRIWLKDESGSEDRYTIARHGEEYAEPGRTWLAPELRRRSSDVGLGRRFTCGRPPVRGW